MDTRPRGADAAPQRDATLDFLRLLWSIQNCLQSTSKRMAASLGITGPQRLVLRIVAQFPGIAPKEVAHLLRLHPSTITGVIQRLTDKRLLERTPDTTDRRRVRLRVTSKAGRFTRSDRGTVEAAVTRALRRTPPASVRRARQLLAAIVEELNDAGNGHALDAGRIRRAGGRGTGSSRRRRPSSR